MANIQSEIKKFWSYLFNILCIIGCSYQVQNVFFSYFAYETVTQNDLKDPTVLLQPSLHLCFAFTLDGLNRSALISKYGLSTRSESIRSVRHWIDTITTADIFAYTPNTAIVECKIRDKPGNEWIETYDADQCDDIFSTRKYVFEQYVCYQMTMKERSSYRFKSIENSMRYDKVLMDLRLGAYLSQFRKIHVALTETGLPHISRAYNPSFYKSSHHKLGVYIRCTNFTINSLGYPYEKFTCEKNANEHFNCYDNCLRSKTLSQWHRIPHSTFHRKGEDQLMVSLKLLKNVSISSLLNEYVDNCKRQCSMYPCIQSYCITAGSADNANEIGSTKPGSTVRVETPGLPDTFIFYQPKVSLLDFMIYVLSSLGTWFGLVIISCNPVVIFSQHKIKNSTVVQYPRQKTVRSDDWTILMKTIGFWGR